MTGERKQYKQKLSTLLNTHIFFTKITVISANEKDDKCDLSPIIFSRCKMKWCGLYGKITW